MKGLDLKVPFVFKAETDTEFDIRDVSRVSPYCDAYGAKLRVRERSWGAWYKVELLPGRKASGSYAYREGYAYISFDDFARLKPLLEESGWIFHRSQSGGPFFADGATGVRPNAARDAHSRGSRQEGVCLLPLNRVLTCGEMEALGPSIRQLLQNGSFDVARQRLRQARIEGPQDAELYRYLARVELARGDWNEAVYSILMWIELLIYEMRNHGNISQFRSGAVRNLRELEGMDPIRLKGFQVPVHRLLHLSEESLGTTDAALVAAVNKDPFLLLGLCYVRLFPGDVEGNGLVERELADFQRLQAGLPADCDIRGTRRERVLYGIGLLMALANVRGDVRGLAPKGLGTRWDRRPSYAIYAQTTESPSDYRDAQMRHVLELTVSVVRNAFGCRAIACFSAPLETMLADQECYGNALWVMLCATGRPLVSGTVRGLSSVAAAEAKLAEMRAVGDVYGLQFGVEIDDEDLIAGCTGLDEEQLANWLSRRYNRNVYCGGMRRFEGRRYRLFSFFDIIQF